MFTMLCCCPRHYPRHCQFHSLTTFLETQRTQQNPYDSSYTFRSPKCPAGLYFLLLLQNLQPSTLLYSFHMNSPFPFMFPSMMGKGMPRGSLVGPISSPVLYPLRMLWMRYYITSSLPV